MNDSVIGYGLYCCNCGHIEQFAATLGCATAYLGGDNNKVAKVDVKCALEIDDMRVCKFLNCPYRPIPPEERSVPGLKTTSLEPIPRKTDTSAICRIYK